MKFTIETTVYDFHQIIESVSLIGAKMLYMPIGYERNEIHALITKINGLVHPMWADIIKQSSQLCATSEAIQAASEVEEEEVKGYKAGDYVVVLPDDRYYSNANQGQAQKIVEYVPNDGLPFTLETGNPHEPTLSCHSCRPATDAEIASAMLTEGAIDLKDKASFAPTPATPSLIPFDLEKAKVGAKLVTRDGRIVTEFKHFESSRSGIEYPVIAVVSGNPERYSETGRYDYSEEYCPLDLFLLPEETVIFRALLTSHDTSIAYSNETKCISENAGDMLCVLAFTTIGDKTTVSIAHTY